MGCRDVWAGIPLQGEDARVLRNGGLAGILTGVALILSFVLTAAFIVLVVLPSPPTSPEDVVLLIVQHGGSVLYVATWLFIIAAAFLAILFFVVLGRCLRDTAWGPFGSVMAVVGVTTLAISAVVLAQFQAEMAARYAGASSADRPALLLQLDVMGAFMEGFFTFATGAFLAIGYMGLGMAMAESPRFSKRLARMGLVLGIVLLALLALIPDPHLVQITVVVWSIPVGWALYRGSLSSS